MNGGFSSNGDGGMAMVNGGPSNAGTGGGVMITAGQSNTAVGGSVYINAGNGPGGPGTINIGPVTLQELKVASGFNKYAALVSTDDASFDAVETISNFLLTTSSIVVVTLNTELGATYVINALPGAGTLDVKFSTNVPDGSKLSYVIINP